MNVDFSDLVQKSHALRDSHNTSDIPSLRRPLRQISRESHTLPSHTLSPTSTASNLLANRGFSLSNLSQNVRNASLIHLFEPLKPTDLDTYLRLNREIIITNAIHTSVHHAISQSFDALEDANMSAWNVEKKHLLQLPRNLHHHAAIAPSPSSMQPFASPFRHPQHRAFPVNQHYHLVVRNALRARISATPLPIATQLDDAVLSLATPDIFHAPKHLQHLHSVFLALRYIMAEPNLQPPHEAAYANVPPSERTARFVKAALHFLCLQFREDKMRRQIQLRPVQAKRGGAPGVIPDITAYLNLVFDRGVPDLLMRGPLYNQMPLWPHVYYCLRAGYPGIALEVLEQCLKDGCSDRGVALYQQCLAAYERHSEKRCLPLHLLESLTQYYWLELRNGPDPYQRACFVLISKMDPSVGDKMAMPDSDYSLLFYSVEDYLWLRLNVVHLHGDQPLPVSLASYQLSLSSVREEMKNFGPAHFDPNGDSPLFYAFVLILLGLFSDAINYLDHNADAIAEAAHITFVLYHYGVVYDRPTSPNNTASDDGNSQSPYFVEYAQLLWRYVMRFAHTDPVAAAVYLFTIREQEVRNELLQKLILETKQFEVLLGTSPSEHARGRTGGRNKGTLEELWALGAAGPAMGGWLSVVEAAAVQAENVGDRESAMKLYDVAGLKDRVIAILLDCLSAELLSRGSSGRANVIAQAKEYGWKLESRMARARNGVEERAEKLKRSLFVLVGVCEFMDCVWEERYEEAHKVMEKVQLLPRNDSELVAKTQELKVGGGVWADAICDRMPDIVLAGMEVLVKLHAKCRQGREMVGWTAGQLRGQAKTLVNFSGMMSNVSADISARVVRLEVLMSY